VAAVLPAWAAALADRECQVAAAGDERRRTWQSRREGRALLRFIRKALKKNARFLIRFWRLSVLAHCHDRK